MAVYSVSCGNCGSTRTIRCTCVPGGGHPPQCEAADFDAALNCREGSDCCGQDHHHGQQANESGQPCRPVTITVLDLGAPVS
jgi:hypothetical protein